jgi:hypothetical protein
MDSGFQSRLGRMGSSRYRSSLLSKTVVQCGLAAPLRGRALPFRPKMAKFLPSSPRRRLSLRRGEEEVEWYGSDPGRRSQPA